MRPPLRRQHKEPRHTQTLVSSQSLPTGHLQSRKEKPITTDVRVFPLSAACTFSQEVRRTAGPDDSGTPALEGRAHITAGLVAQSTSEITPPPSPSAHRVPALLCTESVQ